MKRYSFDSIDELIQLLHELKATKPQILQNQIQILDNNTLFFF